MSSSERCTCCPFGFHIDLDFVSYAESVASGRKPVGDRASQLRREATNRGISPVSVFSDSLENMMSDLEDVLIAQPRLPNRLPTSGYMSDCTSYRTVPLTGLPSRTDSFAPAKPPHRLPSTREQPIAYTALGRALSQTKFRRDDPPPETPRVFSPLPSRENRDHLGSFDVPRREVLRRGREEQQRLDTSRIESSRQRYFSASPKMPRRLLASASVDIDDSPLSPPNGRFHTPPPPRTKPTTVSVGVTTGPLPPAKPCTECPSLRRKLAELQEKLDEKEAKGAMADVAVQAVAAHVQKGAQTVPRTFSVAVGTQVVHLVDRASDAEKAKTIEIGIGCDKEEKQTHTQTEHNGTFHRATSPISTERRSASSCTEGVEMRDSDTQTDVEEPRVISDSELTDSIWLMPNLHQQPNNTSPCQSDSAADYDVVDSSELDELVLSVETTPEKKEKEKTFEVDTLKKLLTSEEPKQFVRGGIFRSLRERISKEEEKEEKKEGTTPTEKNTEALKGKILLKKEPPSPQTKVPQPVPAKIPRPKFTKYPTSEERAETVDEEDEACDRLTPLRSEMRSFGTWPRQTPQYNNVPQFEEPSSDTDSDDSEGSYETNEGEDEGPFLPTETLKEALTIMHKHITPEETVTEQAVEWAVKLVQHEWLKVAARKGSKKERVEGFLDTVKKINEHLIEVIINLDDPNGNTALHYAVSHCNLGVTSLLLDNHSRIDMANRAGYSPLMLASLIDISDHSDANVIHRLIRMGDPNARAQPHGQTALMLAVSHGKFQTAKLLIDCGANVNIQDEEGSTALMCAAEHGHKQLVKLLLAVPNVDASLSDCDSSTALSIAVENGHRDIGLLIYAHLNYQQSEQV